MQITLHASSYLLGDDHRLALRTSAFYYIQFISIHPISGQNYQTKNWNSQGIKEEKFIVDIILLKPMLQKEMSRCEFLGH